MQANEPERLLMTLTEKDLDDRLRERAAVLAIADQVERAAMWPPRRTMPSTGFDDTLPAAEPVELALLLHHLEHDSHACTGACRQGRRACPHPEACRHDDFGVVRGLLWSIAVTVAALALALVVSTVW